MVSLKAFTILVLINLIFFTHASSTSIPCPPTLPKTHAKCPKDALKFGICGDWLNGLVHETIGAQPSSKCCSLVKGLADLEAAICLCTAIRANVLGILNVKVPVALSLVVNTCGKKLPKGFKC
ncbi:hypothetical protein Leryth_024534 [Lithospermum erythrorhizon]|uniref:Bifunctional inhibitor/plant lipid transfer protein/seed storage helical domain-containing protein n=1 Tax=Lithospermum erythrorhizon TaxID=34254 RepID=A0AAV3P414_LITER|nr:hypothetical protein Leryth_024534 [Lithospermum erythrorhizon]